ncbi:hypothetical protein TB1_002235 [Malus domestica]
MHGLRSSHIRCKTSIFGPPPPMYVNDWYCFLLGLPAPPKVKTLSSTFQLLVLSISNFKARFWHGWLKH